MAGAIAAVFATSRGTKAHDSTPDREPQPGSRSTTTTVASISARRFPPWRRSAARACRGREAQPRDHDGQPRAPSAVAQRRLRPNPGHPGDLLDEPHGPRLQLPRAGLEIDHPVPVHLPEARHAGGGEDVEHELGRRAGLEARRAGQHLRTRPRRDDDLGQIARAPGVAGDEHGARPEAPGRDQPRHARTVSARSRRCRRPRRRGEPATARRARRGSASSSAPSRERNTAARPPAMMAWTRRGGVPKVGGHSAASSTPRRPLVPAPTKKSRPPPRRASTMRSTARAMAGITRRTASDGTSILAVHEARDLERAQPVEVARRAVRALGGQSLVADRRGRRSGHEVRF